MKTGTIMLVGALISGLFGAFCIVKNHEYETQLATNLRYNEIALHQYQQAVVARDARNRQLQVIEETAERNSGILPSKVIDETIIYIGSRDSQQHEDTYVHWICPEPLVLNDPRFGVKHLGVAVKLKSDIPRCISRRGVSGR